MAKRTSMPRLVRASYNSRTLCWAWATAMPYPGTITTLLAAARIPAASSGLALFTGRASWAPAKSASPEEAAGILAAASKVVIVPGYDFAVAQAQHKVRELYDALSKRGIDVRFSIHPVAGRMPRHMNVLLTDAAVPDDRLMQMAD